MNCPVCKNTLSEYELPSWGWGHICKICSIEYRIDNNIIEAWGHPPVGDGSHDLSMFGEKGWDEVKVWRSGSGNDAYLWKDKWRLPDTSLLDLFQKYLKNEIN